MKPYIKIVVVVMLAILGITALPSPTAQAATSTTHTQIVSAVGSNGCALSPYRSTSGDTRVYIDQCNMNWLIKFFKGVGSGWKDLGKIPNPIAKAIGLMGQAQTVLSFILDRVNTRCGSQGATIYKSWWMPLPWYTCGKNW